MVRPVALDHIVLRVPDVEIALRWYLDVLGLEPVRVEEWRAGEAPFPSARVSGDSIIDFVARDDPVDSEHRGHLDHLCVVVSEGDLDAVMDDDRVEVLSPVMDLYGARGVGRSIYVRDPAGIQVELRTY